MNYQVLTSIDHASYLVKKQIADFLYMHLDEYADKKTVIMKCLDYALSYFPHQGGYVILAKDNNKIVGAVVVTHTGMEGYIPANALVYLAVHSDYRQQGIATKLMQKAIRMAKGGMSLRVAPDNPAFQLFEKLGFSHKYLEMRLFK
jgi:[ribosomal protein S18]-alanine N-acetyltransferase